MIYADERGARDLWRSGFLTSLELTLPKDYVATPDTFFIISRVFKNYYTNQEFYHKPITGKALVALEKRLNIKHKISEHKGI